MRAPALSAAMRLTVCTGMTVSDAGAQGAPEHSSGHRCSTEEASPVAATPTTISERMTTGFVTWNEGSSETGIDHDRVGSVV